MFRFWLFLVQFALVGCVILSAVILGSVVYDAYGRGDWLAPAGVAVYVVYAVKTVYCRWQQHRRFMARPAGGVRRAV